jgi:hypothetical protein
MFNFIIFYYILFYSFKFSSIELFDFHGLHVLLAKDVHCLQLYSLLYITDTIQNNRGKLVNLHLQYMMLLLILIILQVFGEELIDATSLKYISDDFIHLAVIGKLNSFPFLYIQFTFRCFYKYSTQIRS